MKAKHLLIAAASVVLGLSLVIVVLIFFSGRGQEIVSDLPRHDEAVPVHLTDITGSRLGQLLREPVAVAVDDEGNIYVSDTGNSRIAVFNSAGRFLRSIGNRGKERLSYPYGIVVTPTGLVMVADAEKNAVFVFDKKGNFVRYLFSPEAGIKPGAMALGADGLLYLSDLKEHAIRVWDPVKRDLLQTIKVKGLTYPQGLWVTKEGIWVANAGGKRYVKIDRQGRVLQALEDVEGKRFGLVRGVAVDSRGRLLVTDTLEGTLYLLDKRGRMIKAIERQFNGPMTLFIDQKGAIYVADRFNDQIQVWGYPPPAR